jgi:hypothetical protein
MNEKANQYGISIQILRSLFPDVVILDNRGGNRRHVKYTYEQGQWDATTASLLISLLLQQVCSS